MQKRIIIRRCTSIGLTLSESQLLLAVRDFAEQFIMRNFILADTDTDTDRQNEIASSHARALTHNHTCTHALSHTCACTHTHTHTLSLSLCAPLSLLHTLSLYPSHTHTLLQCGRVRRDLRVVVGSHDGSGDSDVTGGLQDVDADAELHAWSHLGWSHHYVGAVQVQSCIPSLWDILLHR